jgi:hypothetical protein
MTLSHNLPRRKAMNTSPETDRKGDLRDEGMKRLHYGDLQAGRIVVGIITGVFFVGLFLYSFIWWTAKLQ